jgi:hypothetical protein
VKREHPRSRYLFILRYEVFASLVQLANRGRLRGFVTGEWSKCSLHHNLSPANDRPGPRPSVSTAHNPSFRCLLVTIQGETLDYDGALAVPSSLISYPWR